MMMMEVLEWCWAGLIKSFDDFSILPRNTSASLSPSPQTPPSRRPMMELINHPILHSIPSLSFFLFQISLRLPLVCTIFHFLEHVNLKLRETCTIYINDLLKLEIHVNSLSKCLSNFFKSTTLITLTSLSSLIETHPLFCSKNGGKSGAIMSDW